MSRMSNPYRDALNRVEDGNRDAGEISRVTGVPAPVVEQMIRKHGIAVRNHARKGPEF